MSTSTQQSTNDNRMQIYNLIVTAGNVKIDYGYYSQVALNIKLTTLLADYSGMGGRVITIKEAIVQLVGDKSAAEHAHDQIKSAVISYSGY